MSQVMQFDEVFAQKLERIYSTPDVIEQRDKVLSLIQLRVGERALDIGTGTGMTTEVIAESVGASGSVVGIDISDNVLELAKAPISGMDVIFCQNLLIYFRRWRRREILNRLAERLAPGGLMVLGVGEVVGWQHPDLDPVPNEQVLAFTRKG